ncbi:MAG: efflux RND transporter periplasmic adaptor subunit, partial [Candidatus Binataceae bacterium]
LGTTAALRHITLRAPSSGRVVGLNLQSGDRVHKGEIVAHVINRELLAAQNGLKIAEKLDPQEAKSLQASVNRYTRGSGVPVKAPSTAIVSQRLVSPGQEVAYLDPLADLVDPKSIYVEAQIPIDDESLINPGMTAVVTSPVRPNEKFPAVVQALSPSVNANSATAGARLRFTGSRRITISGAAVNVHVTTKSVPNALVIPQAALFEDASNDTYYVFVARDGIAHRVPVSLGIREPNLVQITSGLTQGEMVITSGGYALSQGLRIKVAPLPHPQ